MALPNLKKDGSNEDEERGLKLISEGWLVTSEDANEQKKKEDCICMCSPVSLLH